MLKWDGTCVTAVVALVCALVNPQHCQATGVPINGFLPMAGISLTDQFQDEDDALTFFQAQYETSLVGTQFGFGGTPHYDIALLDTGAATTLITTAADAAFDIAGAGFRGYHPLPIGGATGGLVATTNDPLAIYASGVGPSNRTGSAPLTLNTGLMIGQSSVSLATLPAESDLPNVLGIPFTSQYSTYIRNDEPQIFTLNGKTVRTPQVEFLPLGSGGQGIVRRAPIVLDDPISFVSPPSYIYDIENIFADPPVPWSEHPQYPTLRVGGSGQPAAAYFVNVNVANNGNLLTNSPFLLDTGADVSVVSEINAVNLGFDPVLDTPDFTVAVVGSGGVKEDVPGFYVDQFTIPAVGGSITLTHVPFIVFDFPNPAQLGNVAQGLIGMNALAGRNVAIDPNPATGQGGSPPSLYISDPVTKQRNWSSDSATATWGNGLNWTGGLPDILSIANVRHVGDGDQKVLLQEDRTIWELNISGSATQTMTLEVQNGARLTTFSGVNIETNGVVQISSGSLDAQYIDVRGGMLTGNGSVFTGSGPIAGQVENHGGVIAPGNGPGTLKIAGRFANAVDGTMAVELGGLTAGSQYDQLIVDGAASIDGTLSVAVIDDFAPVPGNTFAILTATEGIGGVFDSYSLPEGYVWNITYGVNSILAKVIGVGISGDFNLNGIVDAADYVDWRDGLGTNYQQADLNIWLANFGKTAPPGAGTAAGRPGGAIPEPASAAMFIAAALGVATIQRRRSCCWL